MKLDSINAGLRLFKSQKIKSKYTILLAICCFAWANTSQAQGQNSLIWTAGDNTINTVNVDGSGLTVLQTGLTNNPSGIAVTDSKQIYWTEFNGIDNVRRINLDGSDITTIIANDANANANAIAIDEINSKIYWADFGNTKISRANLDGSNVELLIDGSSGISAEAIALDVANGHIYIGSSGALGIKRSNLDGSGIITLNISTDQVIAVELDLNANKIYWTEFGPGTLNRANLDGSNIENIYTNATKPFGLALDTANGLIYWTEFSGAAIKSANLDGSNVVEIISGLQSPRYIDIRIYYEQVFAHGFEGCDFVFRDADVDGFGDPAIQMTSCEPIVGFVSNKLDCDDTDDQIKPGVFDDPDNSYIDQNCDGIDGDVSKAIFVSLTDGDNNNPGTITSPIRDINVGVTQAVSLAKTQVYVAQAIYQELVILANGISLYGGYNDQDNWARGANKSTILSDFDQDTHRIAISGEGINLTTVIDNFNIATTNATLAGASNIGLYCNNCDGLVISNNTIQIGDAAVGATGTNGANGRDGLTGNNGTNGCEGINCGFGGAPRFSPFFRDGGGGGRGGYDTENGIDGLSGSFGSPGGIGSADNSCGDIFPTLAGEKGIDGTDGTDGSTGSIGSNGFSISSGYRIGNSGSSGSDGFNGNGGGGGGGGGGGNGGIFCFADKGGGGGGGGTGGEGGKGSSGGGPGGSVFGIFLLNSPNATILSNNIFPGALGAGGAGGISSGGISGTGGLGGSAFDDSDAGGAGGNGGAGGAGGPGGQGADGVSEAIFNN